MLIAVISLPASATALTAMLKTPYFTVQYDPSTKALAESTADMARSELIRVSYDLGYTIERGRQIPLKVYPTHLAFIKEGGVRNRYTVGTTRSGDEAIAIDGSGALTSVRQVLAHEITHAVIFRILGINSAAIPLWVNEGLAKYESEDRSPTDDAIIAESVSNGDVIPLNQLETSFPSERDNLAYAESASAMRYLVNRYGKQAPMMLLAELAQSGSFDKAIAKVTGENEKQFVAQWTGSLSHRFEISRLWYIAGAFGGVAMALLAVLAFAIRRKRMREAARQWEWEEFEESMERQLREWPHR